MVGVVLMPLLQAEQATRLIGHNSALKIRCHLKSHPRNHVRKQVVKMITMAHAIESTNVAADGKYYYRNPIIYGRKWNKHQQNPIRCIYDLLKKGYNSFHIFYLV
jgi:hypothetical protein